MRPMAVVGVDVAAERSSRLVDAVIGPQIRLLVFDTAPEALEEHVIAPRAPAVHLDRACVRQGSNEADGCCRSGCSGRGCNSGRYWSAWSNQQHPISVDIENQPLGRTGLPVLVEQIPAGVQASLRLKTTSFVRFDFTARVARIG